MGFSLKDLLIATGIELSGCIPVYAIKHRLGIRVAPKAETPLVIFFGMILYLLISPPVYQCLRWRPLLFPVCPTCKDRNRFFWLLGAKPPWPVEHFHCSNCSSSLELWYRPPRDGEIISSQLASFKLVWPQSWGRWKRLHGPEMDVPPS